MANRSKWGNEEHQQDTNNTDIALLGRCSALKKSRIKDICYSDISNGHILFFFLSKVRTIGCMLSYFYFLFIGWVKFFPFLSINKFGSAVNKFSM